MGTVDLAGHGRSWAHPLVLVLCVAIRAPYVQQIHGFEGRDSCSLCQLGRCTFLRVEPQSG
jgi:hypothetical protein